MGYLQDVARRDRGQLDQVITVGVQGPATLNRFGESVDGGWTDYELWAARDYVAATFETVTIGGSVVSYADDERTYRIRWRPDVAARLANPRSVRITDDVYTERLCQSIAAVGRQRWLQLTIQ